MKIINRGIHSYNGEPVGVEIEVAEEEGIRRLSTFAGSTRFNFERAGLELKINKQADQSEKVTVLIPVYNGEKYIRESVESILAQTYKNIEVLIYNDGSTDGTDGIIKELASRDHRIARFESKENKGVGFARKQLMDNCKTRVAAWQDADDIAKPERIEKQMIGLQELEAKLPGNMLMVFCDWEILGEGTGKIMRRMCKQLNCVLFTMNSSTPRPEPAMRRNEDEKWHADMVSAGYYESNVPAVLQTYREHADSLTFQHESVSAPKPSKKKGRA
jgi:glycosyltransferase involved in cell wall biosynthesis